MDTSAVDGSIGGQFLAAANTAHSISANLLERKCCGVYELVHDQSIRSKVQHSASRSHKGQTKQSIDRRVLPLNEIATALQLAVGYATRLGRHLP